MSDRFKDLKKLPGEPAARLLALAGAKLATPLTSPASASVTAVLNELAQAEDGTRAGIDMLRLLSVALPVREGIWWGCLAARDLVGADAAPPPPLAAAEAWVFKPSDENRTAARRALDAADIDDDTALCAVAVSMCDGKLGPGEMQQYEAPPGGVASAVFGLNLLSLGQAGAEIGARQALLVDRALDIARGGNGRVAPPPPAETEKGESPT